MMNSNSESHFFYIEEYNNTQSFQRAEGYWNKRTEWDRLMRGLLPAEVMHCTDFLYLEWAWRLRFMIRSRDILPLLKTFKNTGIALLRLRFTYCCPNYFWGLIFCSRLYLLPNDYPNLLSLLKFYFYGFEWVL